MEIKGCNAFASNEWDSIGGHVDEFVLQFVTLIVSLETSPMERDPYGRVSSPMRERFEEQSKTRFAVFGDGALELPWQACRSIIATP